MPKWTPKHTSFMDPDMLRLFERMSPSDLKNYRMFGGTALALYINHRHSVDFDFFSETVVRRSDLQRFDWLSDAEFHGDEGMVDVIVSGTSRNITLKFIDLKLFSNVEPKFPPAYTPNGISVANPVDLLASKLAALSNRKEVKEFLDIATVVDSLPQCLDEAIPIYLESPLTRETSRLDLARTIQNYSLEVEHGLKETHVSTLEKLINKLHGNQREN